VEAIAFEVAGQRNALEEDHARDAPPKLRGLANGEYPQDVADLENLGFDPRWIGGAVALADHIDRWYAEERTDAIVLDGLEAEAMYAILSLTYSDGWAASGRYRLWAALGNHLGYGTGKNAPPG
jgi:hypothetical protein